MKYAILATAGLLAGSALGRPVDSNVNYVAMSKDSFGLGRRSLRELAEHAKRQIIQTFVPQGYEQAPQSYEPAQAFDPQMMPPTTQNAAEMPADQQQQPPTGQQQQTPTDQNGDELNVPVPVPPRSKPASVNQPEEDPPVSEDQKNAKASKEPAEQPKEAPKENNPATNFNPAGPNAELPTSNPPPNVPQTDSTFSPPNQNNQVAPPPVAPFQPPTNTGSNIQQPQTQPM